MDLLQKILQRKSRKAGCHSAQDPLNIWQMERVLFWVSCLSGLAGLSAAFFSLALWYWSLRLIFGNVGAMVAMGDEQALALLAVSVITFCFWLLMRNAGRRGCQGSFEAYPNAAAYHRQCARAYPMKTALCFVAWVSGYILSVSFPYYLRYSDLGLALAVCAGMAAYSAFFLVFRFQERRICAGMKVRRVQGFDESDLYDLRRERKREIIRWSVYWIAALAGYLALSIVFRNILMYAVYFILAFANFLLRIINNNPFRSFSGIRRKRVTVRGLNVVSTLFLAGLSLYAIENGSNYNKKYIESLDYEGFEHDSSFTYDSKTGVYTIWGTSEEFRILQLTDTHICGSIATIQTDRRALTACYDLIKETQPNLIVITGDLVYPMPFQTFSKDNLGAVGQLCELMDNIGIPWIFVYGNHDTETAAAYRAEQLTGVYRYYSQPPSGSLLYAAIQPEIYGRYNQYIRVHNSDDSLNSLLFLIDSNDYIKDAGNVNEYDSVHEDQIQWYEDTIEKVESEEGRLVPSFVFMHIPFPAFAQAQEALRSGSGDAVYLFGENGEGVSCPERESGFFEAIVQKQSTRAVFVGHDHLNNMAVKYKGVDLVYSKSIDYYAYPGIADRTEQRGATLITLFSDGSYQIKQVDYEK